MGWPELMDVWDECKEPDWDGYGADPVSLPVIQQVERLLGVLPADLPPPSFGAEPDGSITMEWYRRTDWVLSVSIDRTDTVHYAWRLGNQQSCGSCGVRDQFPSQLLDVIRELFQP
jgi:hypothetical protein